VVSKRRVRLARPGRRSHPPPNQPATIAADRVAPTPPSPPNGVVVAGWTGPLPPPQILEQFGHVVPDGAERIFKQFEAEAAHRRKQEDRDVRSRIRGVHIGQALAGLYALGAFGLSGYAIAHDAAWAGVLIGGGTIVGGIVAFLGQRKG